MTASRPYRLVINDDLWDDFRRLPNDAQRNVILEFLRDHAQYSPTTRIPGKMKMLRGVLHGHYEFRVDRSYRLIYRVDEDSHEVVIEYIGRHPESGELERRLPRLRE